MQYINDNELLKMNIIEDNSKEKHSPKIRDNIIISSNAIYYYVLNNIINNNYEISYKIQQQLKIILRCIWHTLYSRVEYPDINLFNDINKTFKNFISSHNDNSKLFNNMFIKNNKAIINYKTNNIDQSTLLLIQYCLIPDYKYNDMFYNSSNNINTNSSITNKHSDNYNVNSSSEKQFKSSVDIQNVNSSSEKHYNTELFDKYLFIFKNILLSNNITLRGNLKKDKLERIKEAQSKEEIKDISDDYDSQVNSFKNNNIFKIVNYLNYLYYTNINDNSTSDNSQYNPINKQIIDKVLRCLLLRYTSIEDNYSLSLDGNINYSKDIHLSELIKHDENDYREYINNIFVSLIKLQNINSSSEKQLVNSSSEYTRLLTIFYISIAIYKYQFIHNDLSTYINEYINIMLHDLTKHQININEFINKLIDDIINSYKIVSIFKTDSEIIELIKKTVSFNKFTYKTKNIYNYIINNMDKDIVEQSNITQIYNDLLISSEVRILFNKLSVSNYNSISKQLMKYSIETLLKIFVENYIDVTNSYTPIILQYLLYGRTEPSYINRREYIYNNILAKKKNVIKSTLNNYIDIVACLLCVTNEERYYYILDDEYRSYVIISCQKFISYMDFSTKKFIKNKANEYKLIVKDGYRKFSLENILDKLD